MPQYRVVSPIKSGGVTHQPNDVIHLTEENAAELLKHGAVVPEVKPFTKTTQGSN